MVVRRARRRRVETDSTSLQGVLGVSAGHSITTSAQSFDERAERSRATFGTRQSMSDVDRSLGDEEMQNDTHTPVHMQTQPQPQQRRFRDAKSDDIFIHALLNSPLHAGDFVEGCQFDTL